MLHILLRNSICGVKTVIWSFQIISLDRQEGQIWNLFINNLHAQQYHIIYVQLIEANQIHWKSDISDLQFQSGVYS